MYHIYITHIYKYFMHINTIYMYIYSYVQQFFNGSAGLVKKLCFLYHWFKHCKYNLNSL